MNLIHQFIQDLKVEVSEEFDQNFERKAFFDEKWKDTRLPNHRGSLLLRTGALRRSIRSEVQGNLIRFFSSLPYALIHNEGGEIAVTAKMKRYFWAMCLKAGKARGSAARMAQFQEEAAMWKAMALKKVGSRIRIPQRQFLGHHPRIDQVVEKVFQGVLNKHEMIIKKTLKP